MSRVYPHKLGPRGFTISKRKSLPFTDEACHTTTNMSDDDECVVCYDRPRAVRTQPCGHAFYCELCTIRAVQVNGLKCGVCRCAVLQLVVVPVNPAGDPLLLRSMQTYQAEPEPEGSAFDSVAGQA